MDENKDIIEETLEEAVEETSEAAEEAIAEEVEETEAVVEEALEEAVEEAEEAVEEEVVDPYVAVLLKKIKSLKLANRIMAAILAIIACVGLVFGGIKVYENVYNPYNHMGYYNMSGMTIADVAEMNSMTVDEVISQLNLPRDVKPNTYYDVVEFLVPVSTMAGMYGADVETLKEAFGFGAEITGESTWGEALDSMKLVDYVGSEELVEEIIAEYNLDDSVTVDTLWGEIRPIVNKIDYERYLAEQATDALEDVTEIQ